MANMLAMFVTAAVLNSGTVTREVQLTNILLAFVTAAMLNSGTVTRDAHPLNMVTIVCTDAVLNNGTVARDVQLINILLMFTTDAVLNNATVVKAVQPLNIRFIPVPPEVVPVTPPVSNSDTVCRPVQLINILLMFVTVEVPAVMTTSLKPRKVENKEAKDVQLPMWRNAARSHIVNLTFVPPKVNPEAPKLVALNSISNHPVSYACNPVVVFLTFKLNVVRFCPA